MSADRENCTASDCPELHGAPCHRTGFRCGAPTIEDDEADSVRDDEPLLPWSAEATIARLNRQQIDRFGNITEASA